MGLKRVGFAAVASLLLVGVAHADIITTITGAPVAPVGSATGAGLNGAIYNAVPINTTFGGAGGVDSTDGLSGAQSYISGHPADGTYNATSLTYSGNDSTPTNTFLGGDSNGSAGSIAMHINSTIFDANGFVTIPNAGTYTFGVNNSDDGSFVLISGQTVVADGGSHGGQSAAGQVTFNTAGVYPIEVLYYNQQFNGSANSDGGGGATFTFVDAPGATLNTSAPEPASLSLIAFGGLALLRRRQR